jgi:hypothetical protein
MSAHREVIVDIISPRFSGGLQDQARVTNVIPQSSGVSAQSNQCTAYKKVKLDSVLLQVNGMSAHKKVSIDSILPQISGRLQSQENATPQSSGVSAQSNQQTAYKKVRLDSVSPQFSGVSAHKEVSFYSISLQFSRWLQNPASENNVTPQSSVMSA